MEIIRIPRIMQDTGRTLALRGRSIGLVPTMGALHDGHMSLIRLSRMENHATVVSIFVNPAQFGPGEDLEKYPRDEAEDMQKLRAAGVDTLFMPEAGAMYPEGFSFSVKTGELGGKLEGAFRPGHFDGVATVVAKLFNITLPTRAYFGLKDYQQSLIIRRLAVDMNFPVEVVACPTVREEDGLAMSSRNGYLTPEERRAAPAIYGCLGRAEGMLRSGDSSAGEVTGFLRENLSTEPFVAEVQYAGVYDPLSLDELDEFHGKALIAAAVRIGAARLMDNILI